MCCISSYGMINISPGVRAFDSVAFAGTIECEFCFSEHPSKYTHLLPGKHSWIIILHFPPLKRFGCVPTQGAGLIMLFACLWTTFLPGSLYSRLLFFLSFLSQESEVVRMMMLLLHPLELKQPSPILQQSSVLLRVNLSKLCSRIKIYIHCFASGI